MLDPDLAKKRALQRCDLVSVDDRGITELVLHVLLDSACDSIRIEAKRKSCGAGGLSVTNWTAWRLPRTLPHALLIAEANCEKNSLRR